MNESETSGTEFDDRVVRTTSQTLLLRAASMSMPKWLFGRFVVGDLLGQVRARGRAGAGRRGQAGERVSARARKRFADAQTRQGCYGKVKEAIDARGAARFAVKIVPRATVRHARHCVSNSAAKLVTKCAARKCALKCARGGWRAPAAAHSRRRRGGGARNRAAARAAPRTTRSALCHSTLRRGTHCTPPRKIRVSGSCARQAKDKTYVFTRKCDGESLATLVARHGPLPLAQTRHYIRQLVCSSTL